MSKEEKNPANEDTKKEEEKDVKAMDEDDIKIFKRIGLSPCAQQIKSVEEENKKLIEEIKK